MKKVALFGGSFNPPHMAHFEMAKAVHQALGVDEIWFLFTVNWQKDPRRYAPLAHRMAMGRILAAHYPDLPLVMSDIEEALGTHKTYEVLTGLKKKFPDHHFIWAMGADCLADFHTWEHFDRIIEEYPIAVLGRPSYIDSANKSYTALTYPHLKCSDPKELATAAKGWCFIKNDLQEASSSNILRQLQQGRTRFDGPFQVVVDYILQHGLYGLSQNVTAPQEKPEIRHE